MRATYTAVALVAAFAAVLHFAGPLRADPPVPVATENPVPATSYAEVKITMEKGDAVQWEVSPEPTKQNAYTDADTSVLHFNGPPGTYTVTAFVINFDTKKFERRKLPVTLGRPKPKDDDAKPPAPQPPADLLKKVADAFAKDKGQKADAVQLAELYRQAAKLAVKKKGDGYECVTGADLLGRVREAGKGVFDSDTAMIAVRTVAASEVAGSSSMSSDLPMTESQRTAIADTYAKLAACLDTLSK